MLREQEQDARPRRAKGRSRTAAEQRAHLAREVVETLLFVGLVFLIVHVGIQSWLVSDAKMAPQFQEKQWLLVNKQAYRFGGPQRGEVAIFTDPTTGDADHPLLGRVIGIPGDTITINATSVAVNGVTLNEPYVQVPAGQVQNSVVVANLKLGSDDYYLLDDNRTFDGDRDSRSFGPVKARNLQGKAVLVFWPLSSRHWVNTYSSVFSKVGR